MGKHGGWHEPHQEWDAACVVSLFTRLFHQKHPCTQDADALRHALTLLEDQTGEKVFLLTDGYGVGGLVPFARELKHAEESKVDVVGISVGMDESNGRH